eukprot:m.2893 g.2893  ORF g.2893 m.2893 type:complete len:397 (-) comp1825_c0_seq1:194-1384(-)
MQFLLVAVINVAYITVALGHRHNGRPSQCGRAPPYPNCTSNYPRQYDFNVSVVERDPYGHPLVSQNGKNGGSVFPFNFNVAWFPPPTGSNVSHPDGLIVRVQEDCTPNCSPNVSHPEWMDIGALTAVKANVHLGSTEHIDESLVFWAGTAAPPHVDRHEWAALDPRIRYRPKTQEYYLTWDNCTFECGFRTTLLSVSKDPFDHDSWSFVGPVIPGMQTAGVSLLFRDDVPNANHLAFVSTYNCYTISLAESTDGRTWSITNPTWMQGRPGCWDACGAIAGPQPEVLSSGDFLFIYNIDTHIGIKDRNPLGRCTIGWAILDGANPSIILARSSTALVTPTLPWETTECAGAEDTCQTPFVIFADGLKPLGNDEFMVIYGGGDSVGGAIKIKVDVKRF